MDKYTGKTIFLVGPAGRNEIVPFQHTFSDGRSETIGLRLNTAYRVGDKDEGGKIIHDWVYESYLTSEYNNMREKTRTEKELENRIIDGDSAKYKSGEIME